MTDSITSKYCRTFCLEYVIFEDWCSHGSGISRQVSLYNIRKLVAVGRKMVEWFALIIQLARKEYQFLRLS